MPVWLQVLLPIVSVGITALVTWHITQRRIAIENVTQERAKWRSNIRQKALEAHDATVNGCIDEIERFRHEFEALLNPYDPEDRKLVDCLPLEYAGRERRAWADEFALRVALLLKHDWERAKWEASSLRWFRHEPKRPATSRVGVLNRRRIGAGPGREGLRFWRATTVPIAFALLAVVMWLWTGPAPRPDPEPAVSPETRDFVTWLGLAFQRSDLSERDPREAE